MSHPGRDAFDAMTGNLKSNPALPALIKQQPKQAQSKLHPQTSQVQDLSIVKSFEEQDFEYMYEDENGIRRKGKAPEQEGPTLKEKLEEEGSKFVSKFGNVLYPKSVLAAYDWVMTGNWNISDGSPEPAIDLLLKEFVDSISDKAEYFRNLKTALSDTKIRTCLALRLTYAALLEQTVDEVSIHTHRKSALLCQDKMIATKNDGMIYVGDSPIDMKDDDLFRRAEDFYSTKKIVSQSISGLELSKRQKLAQMVIDLGFEFVQDSELVYNEIQHYANDYETALVARLAFLLLTKDNDQKLLG